MTPEAIMTLLRVSIRVRLVFEAQEVGAVLSLSSELMAPEITHNIITHPYFHDGKPSKVQVGWGIVQKLSQQGGKWLTGG